MASIDFEDDWMSNHGGSDIDDTKSLAGATGSDSPIAPEAPEEIRVRGLTGPPVYSHNLSSLSPTSMQAAELSPSSLRTAPRIPTDRQLRPRPATPAEDSYFGDTEDYASSSSSSSLSSVTSSPVASPEPENRHCSLNERSGWQTLPNGTRRAYKKTSKRGLMLLVEYPPRKLGQARMKTTTLVPISEMEPEIPVDRSAEVVELPRKRKKHYMRPDNDALSHPEPPLLASPPQNCPGAMIPARSCLEPIVKHEFDSSPPIV